MCVNLLFFYVAPLIVEKLSGISVVRLQYSQAADFGSYLPR